MKVIYNKTNDMAFDSTITLGKIMAHFFTLTSIGENFCMILILVITDKLENLNELGIRSSIIRMFIHREIYNKLRMLICFVQ